MILVLGGTVEARRLIEILDVPYLYSSYSDYGERVSGAKNAVSGPKDVEDLKKLVRQNGISKIVDLTHPYATEVSKNAMEVARELGLDYLRYERPDDDTYVGGPAFFSQQEAARVLKDVPGEIFLTTGSKELEVWEPLKSRTVIRILPLLPNLKKALDLGFEPSRIICAQGPFTKLENLAVIERYGIKYLVTKESGAAARFEDKIKACKSAGVVPIVIKRPKLAYTKVTSKLEEVLDFCDE